MFCNSLLHFLIYCASHASLILKLHVLDLHSSPCNKNYIIYVYLTFIREILHSAIAWILPIGVFPPLEINTAVYYASFVVEALIFLVV